MAENIVEAVRQDLGFEPLKKIDPNLQNVKDSGELTSSEKLAQAAIPSVLAAFAVFAKTDRGAEIVLSPAPVEVLDLFIGKHEQVIKSVAEYAGVSEAVAAQTMEKITQSAEAITVKAAEPEPTVDKIRSYLAGQRHNILTHLPASLQLGKILDDNSIDDRTNKMEGPLSNIAHAIENALSGSGEPK